MSIYATQWEIKVWRCYYSSIQPRDGVEVGVRRRDGVEEPCDEDKEWVEVVCQGVPGHIGHAEEYPEGDPFREFLPPPLTGEDYSEKLRAVVIITGDARKGTERSGQEYIDPLLTLSGAEYEHIGFQELMGRIQAALEMRVTQERNS